ncbi:MAG TPA: prephenate dehydratase [Candidatus Nitrosopolaris sp.]|nr:prephenate dehydratase [Candidatus Nitrosopolaris sp.]
MGGDFIAGDKRVAFQGEPGSYSEIATIQYFGNSNLVPLKSLQEVFDGLSHGDVDFGVVPIENSIEGSVNETYDLLLDTDFVVSGEIYLRVRHCLIVNKGGGPNIRSVYSHPQALAQCRHYLQARKLAAVAAYDTAGAVKMIKQKQYMDVAAIASSRAAELYEMDILEEGIEDSKNNFTRFLIISKTRTKSTGHDGTSMIFSVKHIPGALYSILEEFANRKINLTKIESRPTKEKPWEYYFYVDFEGHINDKIINETVQSITKKAAFIKILGSYERAEFL